MSATPYFKLYFSDLAGDTLRLSDAEMGSYVLLIGAMWNAGGRLDDDQYDLARIARCTPKVWAKRWPRLARFFIVEDGEITHKRVTAEREKVVGTSAKRSAAGAAGAEAKALKRQQATAAKASETDKQNAQIDQSKQGDIPESIAKGDANTSPQGGEDAAGEDKPRDEVREAFDAYNRMAELCDMPKAEALSAGRRKAIAKRLEGQGLTGWRRALMAAAVSPHCRGKNDRRWKADLDFVCQAKSFQRLLEGFYGTGETVPKATKAEAAAAAPPPPSWPGPAHVRAAVVERFGEDFARSWLDLCRWRDLPTPAVVTDRPLVASRLQGNCTRLLGEKGVAIVLEVAA